MMRKIFFVSCVLFIFLSVSPAQAVEYIYKEDVIGTRYSDSQCKKDALKYLKDLYRINKLVDIPKIYHKLYPAPSNTCYARYREPLK